MLQHSRTPGVVLMVLVICYCAIPPVSTYAYGQDSGSTFYCPYRHVVKEETQILEASVVEVETKPISVVSLRTATYTTTTTLTAITHLSRTVTIHRPNVQITQMALTTVTITHTAPGNTVVLYGSPATLVVTETQVQRNTVELLQPYVTLAVAPVTTTMLDSTTVTSTNTLEFIVTKTRAWHVTAHQKVYRSTLAKITQETHQIPECSMDVKKAYTHTHAYAHSTTDVTSTIKVVTTTTSYIMETFTTTLLGEGASQCVGL